MYSIEQLVEDFAMCMSSAVFVGSRHGWIDRGEFVMRQDLVVGTHIVSATISVDKVGTINASWFVKVQVNQDKICVFRFMLKSVAEMVVRMLAKNIASAATKKIVDSENKKKDDFAAQIYSEIETIKQERIKNGLHPAVKSQDV